MAKLVRILFECGSIEDYPDEDVTIFGFIHAGDRTEVAQAFSRGHKDPYFNLRIRKESATPQQLVGGFWSILFQPMWGYDTWQFWHRITFEYDNAKTVSAVTGVHYLGNTDGRPHTTGGTLPAILTDGIDTRLRVPTLDEIQERMRDPRRPGTGKTKKSAGARASKSRQR